MPLWWLRSGRHSLFVQLPDPHGLVGTSFGSNGAQAIYHPAAESDTASQKRDALLCLDVLR